MRIDFRHQILTSKFAPHTERGKHIISILADQTNTYSLIMCTDAHSHDWHSKSYSTTTDQQSPRPQRVQVNTTTSLGSTTLFLHTRESGFHNLNPWDNIPQAFKGSVLHNHRLRLLQPFEVPHTNKLGSPSLAGLGVLHGIEVSPSHKMGRCSPSCSVLHNNRLVSPSFETPHINKQGFP